MDMDIENTMRFILDMQARHEAALQKHDEAMQKHDEAIKKHDEAIIRIDAAVEANATRISQLVDVSLSLAHSVEQTNASVRELGEKLRDAQTSTEYKLNALIDIVDKIVRKNGHDRGAS